MHAVEREMRIETGDRDIAGGDQPGTQSGRRTLDTRDHRTNAFIEAAHQPRCQCRLDLHQAAAFEFERIGADTEAVAQCRQHDDAHLRLAGHAVERCDE
jgi:hypothetical protein